MSSFPFAEKKKINWADDSDDDAAADEAQDDPDSDEPDEEDDEEEYEEEDDEEDDEPLVAADASALAKENSGAPADDDVDKIDKCF